MAVIIRYKGIVVPKCFDCDLCKTRRKQVVGRGDYPADVLFIGEGPGASEDMMGLAFVGQTRPILKAAIEQAQLMTGVHPSMFFTNLVQCRPTDSEGKNRAPSRDEVAACHKNLIRVCKYVEAKQVVLLGKVPERYAGKIFPWAQKTYHPAYLLRKGGQSSREFGIFARHMEEVFKRLRDGENRPAKVGESTPNLFP